MALESGKGDVCGTQSSQAVSLEEAVWELGPRGQDWGGGGWKEGEDDGFFRFGGSVDRAQRPQSYQGPEL